MSWLKVFSDLMRRLRSSGSWAEPGPTTLGITTRDYDAFTRCRMPTVLPNVPCSVAFSDADRCAQAIVDRVGYDLRLAVPMSIGKPILIVDALYRLAEADRRVQLTIFTGL